MSDEDLLTTEEVAAILRTPVATVLYWRVHNRGPKSIKVGRRVLYARGDVNDYIRSLRGTNGRATDAEVAGGGDGQPEG